MSHKINHANIKEWAANYDGPLFDGILCDPPYELGFMGKSWDSSGIAFDTDMWADLFKLVKPGGHLLAFSGSRTYHRMAVAIEDAGFEIRDMIEWVYGSGFPKSLNIGKAVDKIQGNEREVLPPKIFPDGSKDRKTANHKFYADEEQQENNYTNTKGTSPYEGYGTALKPAHEPICLARKPIEGTVANNVLKYGTGGLAIDRCRVGTEQVEQGREGRQVADSTSYHNGLQPTERTIATGRFPANLIHDGSDEVEAVFPQAGNNWKRNYGTEDYKGKQYKGGSFGGGGYDGANTYADSGSASRFFYTAKASKSERNAGLEGFEVRDSTRQFMEGTDPEYICSDGSKRTRALPQNSNHHPTVKPLSLTKYLATLIKPPSGAGTGGRLLVPFSGSGSEMIGALQAGWEYVEGVELTEEYIPIAEARIKHWVSKPVQETLL
jgi:DNA modification methylase